MSEPGAQTEAAAGEVARPLAIQPVGSTGAEEAGREDNEASDSEPEAPPAFDFAALEEAQRSAAVGGGGSLGATEQEKAGASRAEKKQQRGGNKETKRKKKKQRREDDLLRAKKAGLKVPSLKEALEAVASAKKARTAEAASSAEAGASAAPGPSAAGSSFVSPFVPQPAAAVAAPAAAVVSAPDGVAASFSGSPPAAASTPPAASLAVPAAAPSAALAAGAAPGPVATGASAAPARAPAPTAQTQLLRAMHSYADAVDTGSSSSAAGPTVPADPAMMARVVKDAVRHARAVEALSAQRIFVTNVPFKATEEELKSMLGKSGSLQSLKRAADKSTGKFLGYAHATFDSTAAAQAALKQCDRQELHDREIRVSEVKRGEKFQFDLPVDIQEELKALMREAYEGKNLSTIKDAWQKRHDKKKLDTCRWGFKNFSGSVRSIEGVVLETHAEKALTNLAFFEGSPVHKAFLEEKARVVKERKEKEAQEQAEKRKREEEQASAAAATDAATEEGPPRKAARTEEAGTTGASAAASEPAVASEPGAAAGEVKAASGPPAGEAATTPVNGTAPGAQPGEASAAS